MAPQFQVNINISAGADFTQEFIINNPDASPVGDVADRETKVTGPVKTTEVAGPYLTLSSSSGRFAGD